MIPMVGASAAVSALMAGAARFVFSAGGPLRTFQGAGPEVFRRPALPLAAALGDRRVAIFLAVWFGLNLVFGLLPDGGGLASGAIAWEAHVGGFLAGLLLFPLFDPVPRAQG
jgi:membrane associated rhomboid family serine protease